MHFGADLFIPRDPPPVAWFPNSQFWHTFFEQPSSTEECSCMTPAGWCLSSSSLRRSGWKSKKLLDLLIPRFGSGRHIYRKTGLKIGLSHHRFAIEGHPTRYGFGKNKSWFLGSRTYDPWGTQFWVRGHRYRKTGFKIGHSDPDLLRKDTQHDVVSGKTKTWFLGSRTHDPWEPSYGSGVIDTGKLVSKSDSATPICYERTPNTIWFRQKQNLVFGVTNPWPLGTQFWVRGHRYRKTGFKIGLSDPDLLWKDTQHDMVSAKTKLGFWGHEPMTPGYPVLGQGSSIQENWFQNRTQRPRFAMEGHPTRYGFGKNKTWFLGSRTHDPWVPSFGSGVIDTGKLVSKSDSATPICYGRTPNTIWFRQKQNLVFGVTNPWPLGTQFWVRGHRYRKTGFKIGLSDPDLLWKDTQHDMVSAKTKLGFWGHEPMTPGYPVLGQGSSIQENWFQNRTQRPRFAMEGHPTRYGSAKRKKNFFLNLHN